MKKVEHFLFLPVLILLFYGASKYSSTVTDIHLHDTFYVITNASITGWFLAWLGIVFILFKIIRRRHVIIHTKFAFTYIVLTVLLFGVFIVAGLVGGPSDRSGYTDADLDVVIARNLFRMVTVYCFLAVQFIFLIYFIIQMVKQPVIRRQ
jgi:hypothetical protein